MSKKRPGFQASQNLVNTDDVSIWEGVELGFQNILEAVPNLKEYESELVKLSSKDFLNKHDLLSVVRWKHTVGKKRIYNLKHLDANTDATIQEYSRLAVAAARRLNLDECVDEDGSLSATGRKSIQEVLSHLVELKGVGPATASAILTLVRPDLFCYLYDEAIDCFESKRDYTVPVYLRVNSRCLEIANRIGGWTPARVAKSIWIAARLFALTGEDLTEVQGQKKKAAKDTGLEGNDKPGRVKRQKKK